MIRERTFLNLAIGLVLSLLLHIYLVIWGPQLSLTIPASRTPTEVEVQLREWPVPPVVASPEEPLPAPSLQEAKPSVPANTRALTEAVQAVLREVSEDRLDLQLPERPIPTQALEPSADSLRIAQALLESLRQEPRLGDATLTMPVTELDRKRDDRHALPPLPAIEHGARREAVPLRPVSLPLSPSNPASQIKGPAAERQVIFQPPPPNATVESESDIELRFWILPNGTVSRVVPLKKADPRLEALAINYLRNWRFNPLPPDVAPEEQWGIIPFKFRIR